MKKKAIILMLIVVFVVILVFYKKPKEQQTLTIKEFLITEQSGDIGLKIYKNNQAEPIRTIVPETLYDIIIESNPDLSSIQDIIPGPLFNIERNYTNRIRDEVYIFVEIPSLSGAQNLVGEIIAVDVNSGHQRIVGGWGGVVLIEARPETISPNGKYMAFSSIWHSSSVCGLSSGHLIKLEEGGVLDLATPKVVPNEPLDFDGNPLQEIITDLRWDEKSNLMFNSHIGYCSREEPLSNPETWQYNIETKEYKLILKENE